MVAAQVSPLERRELLDGTTGYGSYDPYGTSSSGSDSGSSSSSSGYADGSMSGSMSGSSPMAPSGNGSTPGATSGSPNGSQPPATVGTINVRVAGPNEPMNRWSDLNLNGAASSNGNTGATGGASSSAAMAAYGPTGNTGSTGTSTPTVIDPLTVFGDVPFQFSGDYFGPGPAEVYVEYSDGTVPQTFPVTGNHFDLSGSVKAKGSTAWARATLRDADGTVLDNNGNPAISEAFDNVIRVDVKPGELLFSADITAGAVKDWLISLETSATHQMFQSFSASGAIRAAAEDEVLRDPFSGRSVQDYENLFNFDVLPFMEEFITTTTSNVINLGVDRMFGGQEYTFSMSMGASSPYLARALQLPVKLTEIAIASHNYVLAQQNALNNILAPFVKIEWASHFGMLTSQNMVDVFHDPTRRNFENLILDTTVINRIGGEIPLNIETNAWFPTGAVGVYAEGISLRHVDSFGAGVILRSPKVRLLGQLYFQGEASYFRVQNSSLWRDNKSVNGFLIRDF